eukprot:TRINITY_DN3335_c0_g1_i2.p1 TRINITY_DN3335_c0_g1~~TRINITY_DN3335_c0_g1_i2.p1  ORF type:complete len:514 (-),score=123.98 TRINITY_DN3335_c0_g1_i2:299-1840(-)
MKRGHDATMSDPSSNLASVLCCSCGVPMQPNQTMRCAQCLKSEVSIIEGVSRQVVLPHCRNCNRYNKPGWTACEPESRELLGICLKRIRGLSKDLRLVDAAFIWTEEHSKRIRVKITVQKEVANASVLQQSMVIEFEVVNQQCEDCTKSFTPHTFNGIVQVRQKVSHRRTFCYLEQLILKHEAHAKVVSLKESREGLDFHFAQRSHAQRFADFIASCVPTKHKNSKQLCSHDANSNIYNYKYTIMATLCPICVDDVVFVPKGHSAALSGAAPLMLCHKVSNAIRLLDPLTMRGYDIPANEYWKRPLDPVLSRQHFTEFIVLSIEPVEAPEAGTPAKHNLAGRQKMQLADIEVARVQDFGNNDDRYIVRSHLGNALRPGNRALGYDLRAISVSGLDTEGLDKSPADFFLVKRHYKRKRGKRAWDLQRLDREKEEGAAVVEDDEDMEALRQDLEEDAELRRGVNMFANASARAGAGASSGSAPQQADDDDADEDEDGLAPEVPLAELLEGLELKD